MATRLPTAWRHRLALLGFIVALSVAGVGHALEYSAEPIRARVVDADTGKPVEGANVVAAWVAKGGLEGGNIMGYVKVLEDVTDANGEFSFPAWGPVSWVRRGVISSSAPELVIFKPGYLPKIEYERKYKLAPASEHMTSSVNGTALSLKRYEGSMEGYDRHLVGLAGFIRDLVGKSCAWRDMPKLLMTTSRFGSSSLTYAGKWTSLQTLEYLEGQALGECRNIRGELGAR